MGDSSSGALRRELLRIVVFGLLVVVPVLAGVAAWKRHSTQASGSVAGPPVTVAVVVPTGAKGDAVADAARLYAEHRNQEGGVSGRPLAIEVHVEGPGAALAAAERAAQSSAIAVVGHVTSSSSLQAAKVYEKAGLAVVSPSATNDAVTAGKPWSFSAIFNDSQQARFLADYAKDVLAASSVGVVAQEDVYGRLLAEQFRARALELGLEIREDGYAQDSVVFLATGLERGAKALADLRRGGFQGPVIGPDAMGTHALAKAVKKHGATEEVLREFYVAVPLLFDTANAAAQRFRGAYRAAYGREPIWHAGYAYDAVKSIATALEREETVSREAALAGLRGIQSSDTGVSGVTGLTFFTKDGFAPKPLAVAVWRGQLVSAFTQLRQVATQDGGTRLSKAQVIYTGIRVHRISEVNEAASTARVEFDVWFRFQEPFAVSDVAFSNAVDGVSLGKPTDSRTVGGVAYRSYRVDATFRTDVGVGADAPLGQQVVSVGVRHRHLSAGEAMFVKDELGMRGSGQDLVADLSQRKVLDPSLNLTAKDAWFAQDISQRHVLGDPKYLFGEGATIEQSTLTFAARVAPTTFTVRRQIETDFADTFLMVGVLAVFLLYGLGRFLAGRRRLGVWVWGLECLAWGAVLLVAEVFMLDVVAPLYNRSYTHAMIKTFDVAWWAWLAAVTITGLSKLVWGPIELRTGRPIPRVARQFAAWLVVALCGFGVLAFAFDQKITGLLATSGLLAMIIGLAIQMNISNIFSGIVLNLERPFRIGDWIEISGELGKVVDVSWRATKLQPCDGQVVSVPNAVAAGSKIINYSFPNPTITVGTDVVIGQEHSPDEMFDLFDRALEAAGPTIRALEPENELVICKRYWGVSERAARYWMGVDIENYDHMRDIVVAVNRAIWHECQAKGVRLISQETSIAVSGTEQIPVDLAKRSGSANTSQPPAN